MQHPLQPDTLSHSTTSPMSVSSSLRPDRPCDICRRRKTRCVVNSSNPTSCVMCDFHKQTCTFLEEALPRKRKAPSNIEDEHAASHKRSLSNDQIQRRQSDKSIHTAPVIDDYADLRGKSLLKKTLGLQNHRHAKLIGATDQHDIALLELRSYDDIKGESPVLGESSTFRRVGPKTFFHQVVDADHPDHANEVDKLDQIESIVAPHGEALIKLYFRIVHPSFPILHKKVYLEKYSRNYHEFSPPLLAAVYILALGWWSYSSELAKQKKPDVAELELIAFRTLQEVANYRPKLSTVQAGLLLLQIPSHNVTSWQTTCLMVGIGQDLGLHLDCSNWRIPIWERGLRKRLAWALFCQDTWSAMILGRPPHLSPSNWAVQPVTGGDFPESAADEDEEDGSTEVEKGRTLFSAMITLSNILSEMLEDLYSLKAEAEAKNSRDCTKTVLAQAKPIQLKLKSWYAEMPDTLRMDATNLKVGKLDSVGYLHLAYFATEIILHRQVIRSLSHKTDPYITQICRSAARARLVSALEFFDQLKPEHLQSFWHFASRFNFALIGSFAGLCHITATSHDEAEFYQRQLQGYRWKLRVSNRSADFLEISSNILESIVGPLLSKSAESNRDRRTSLATQHDGNADDDQEEDEDEEEDGLDYEGISALNDFFFGAIDAFYDTNVEV